MITTVTKRIINPLAFRVEDIHLEDIAHALACCNRFAGHLPRPVSVAQHSVYVSRLCGETHALQGLLHDASEAYIGDVTKWLKSTPAFAEYRHIEDAIQRIIYQHFGCELEVATEVEDADRLMVRFESEVSHGRNTILPCLASQGDTHKASLYQNLTTEDRARVGAWKPWSWRQSKEAFLVQFRLLTER